jgi:hypothetical protein
VTDWQSPKVQLPPQGVKILWFHKGDLYICHRVGEKYISIIPGYCKILACPTLWAIAPVPEPYTGIMRILMKDNAEEMTIDEFEEKYPEDHKEFESILQDRIIESI